ncbi:hypothetical protein PoB_004043200 [Plakobranchus ocellatus]|uniref:Uncharacterized protein n=1 Tax=Plakobranchus ocellatus TaxID=259542 RepID=A0AAV4B344_9GAST|nr:hypothetical protein PoB_004043200 [Plakobranchus ocellatus]
MDDLPQNHMIVFRRKDNERPIFSSPTDSVFLPLQFSDVRVADSEGSGLVILGNAEGRYCLHAKYSTGGAQHFEFQYFPLFTLPPAKTTVSERAARRFSRADLTPNLPQVLSVLEVNGRLKTEAASGEALSRHQAVTAVPSVSDSGTDISDISDWGSLSDLEDSFQNPIYEKEKDPDPDYPESKKKKKR